MKPSICVCCGETIPQEKTGTCKNPNVCRPCDYLVESGTIPALQELIRVLTNLLMRREGPNLPVPSSAQTQGSPMGFASKHAHAFTEQPMIHPDFIEIVSNAHQGAEDCQVWRN